jgi:hypothetical protein
LGAAAVSCQARGHGAGGVKRITVDEQWAGAQQAAERLRQVNRELPGMIEALRREQQAAAERVAAQLAARQDAFDRALSGLSEQAKRIEAQASRRLRAQADRLRQVTEAAEQDRRETRDALEDQERRFQQGLARERRDREREVGELRDEVAAIGGDRDRALARAATLVADGRQLAAAIDAGLPHERYATGRLSELTGRLDLAEGNVRARLGEAALAQAQEVYLQLSELRAEVELRMSERQEAWLAADGAVTVLREQIRVNATPAAVDETGNAVEGFTLDVDYWSEGELSRLEETVAKLTAALADPAAAATTAELRHIAEHEVPALDQALTEVVASAQAGQLASQARANVAELVVTALEETTGYAWEEGQALYANGDQRRAFYSKLKHLDDSEIVIEVAPEDNGESCVLRIISYDTGTPDDEERVRRAHAVAATLREHGLQAGLPAADGQEPDPRLADFDALRRPLREQPRAGRAAAAAGAAAAMGPGQFD